MNKRALTRRREARSLIGLCLFVGIAGMVVGQPSPETAGAPLTTSATTGQTAAAGPALTPPVYFSVSRKLNGAAAGVEKPPSAELLRSAWAELQGQMGANRPKCILVCDNLNDPAAVAAEMEHLAGNTPWAGISRSFRFDLPFGRARIEKLADGKRGVSLLAVCGALEINLGVLRDVEGPADARTIKSLEEQRSDYEKDRNRLRTSIDLALKQLRLGDPAPDHILFLLEPNADFASSLVLEYELQTVLFNRAQVVSPPSVGFVKSGITYFNGKVLTNAIALCEMSGFLPSDLDMPLGRVPTAEVRMPVRNLASAFGPNPLEKVLNFFGAHGIQVLQNADKLEVFEIKSGRLETAPQPGPGRIEGYELVAQGKTLGPQAAQEFATALVSEKNGDWLSNCIWHPVIVFRAWRGRESATLVACFQCNEAELAYYDENGKPLERPGHLDFAGRETFLRLARQALPNSAVLQGIN